MIQRIQSLFLVVVILCGVCLYLFPFWIGENSIAKHLRSPTSITAVVNLLSILLAVVCLFFYKNRKLQIKISYLLTVISILLALVLLVFTTRIFKDDFENGHRLWPSYLPLIAAVAAYMASRYIKKDEELVRSADRIR
jgi:Na+-translocating ferredoxin:NAD+ oxidoreductase RnfA subunit